MGDASDSSLFDTKYILCINFVPACEVKNVTCPIISLKHLFQIKKNFMENT